MNISQRFRVIGDMLGTIFCENNENAKAISRLPILDETDFGLLRYQNQAN